MAFVESREADKRHINGLVDSRTMDDRRRNPRRIGDSKGNYWNGKSSLPYTSFANFEQSVRQEIEKHATEKKYLLRTLPRFAKILNGLRPGELTIFTGPTGCGKTTVLSQMSIDYACQGISVLWGSFEIRNTRLAQVMLQQIAQKPLWQEHGNGAVDYPVGGAISEETWSYASKKLKHLPIRFMNLFGSTNLGTVLDTMELSMGFQDPPSLIILDNLQFMLSGQAYNALDKWELMDRAITDLRAFCNAFPVQVMIVVHPRKEIDDTPLGLASVSGTAKATQEADNVVVLQKAGDKRYLEVKKNRYYGDLGRVRLGYHPAARLVTEIIDDDKLESQALPNEAESESESELESSALSYNGSKDH